MVTDADALEAVDVMVSYVGGVIHLQCWSTERGGWTRKYLCRSGSHLKDVIPKLGESEVLISLARDNNQVVKVPVLWAVVSGKEQEAALRRFKPRPTLILSEGSTTRKTALWHLNRPLSWAWAEKANDRIAYRLRATRKWSDPDVFRFAAPGTSLRQGRKRPVPIVVDRLGLEDYTAKQIVGHLKDAPDKNAWKDKQ